MSQAGLGKIIITPIAWDAQLEGALCLFKPHLADCILTSWLDLFLCMCKCMRRGGGVQVCVCMGVHVETRGQGPFFGCHSSDPPYVLTIDLSWVWNLLIQLGWSVSKL